MIVPAFNEANDIRDAYESVTRAVKAAGIDDYEIIIATNRALDGTDDGTPKISDEIASDDPRVMHIHHKSYADLGFKYRDAVTKAKKSYVVMVPGDNDTIESSFVNILKHVGKAPVVAVYTSNPEARPLYMRFVSRGFVVLCNLLFGMRLKYFNGICVLPRELLLRVPMSADNPSYMAEILIYLIRSGAKYIEVPQEIRYTPQPGKTFRIQSVINALRTLALLFWRVNVKGVRIPLSSEYK